MQLLARCKESVAVCFFFKDWVHFQYSSIFTRSKWNFSCSPSRDYPFSSGTEKTTCTALVEQVGEHGSHVASHLRTALHLSKEDGGVNIMQWSRGRSDSGVMLLWRFRKRLSDSLPIPATLVRSYRQQGCGHVLCNEGWTSPAGQREMKLKETHISEVHSERRGPGRTGCIIYSW